MCSTGCSGASRLRGAGSAAVAAVVPAAPAAQANAAPEALGVLPAASTSTDVEAAWEEAESHTALEKIRAAALAALEPTTAAA